MGMVSDLSEVVGVQLGPIRRFCGHMGRSKKTKIGVTKVFGPEILMSMVSDPLEVVRVRLWEIWRFCSHIGWSQEAKIWS